MAETAPLPTPDDTPGDPLARLRLALGDARPGRGPAPVERWNPAYCGEIDLRIAPDGTWFYNGTPITRPALVKLFATVLRRDADRYVLVTPVERLGIVVEDAPFLAVEMAIEGTGRDRRIAFRTNLDDFVPVDADHPLRFDSDDRGGIKPYVRVRGDLWALVTRALTLDLIELGETTMIDGAPVLGLYVAGRFYPIGAAP